MIYNLTAPYQNPSLLGFFINAKKDQRMLILDLIFRLMPKKWKEHYLPYY